MTEKAQTLYDGTLIKKTGIIVKVDEAIGEQGANTADFPVFVTVEIWNKGELHTVNVEKRNPEAHRGGVGIWFDHMPRNMTDQDFRSRKPE